MLKNISLLLLIFIGVSACSPVDRLIRRGDNALAIGEYAEAAALYQRAYRQTPAKEREQRGRLSYKMGDAYRCYGNVAKAVGNYANAARYYYTDTLTWLRLGDMQRAMGEYGEASKSYQNFITESLSPPKAIFSQPSKKVVSVRKSKRGNRKTKETTNSDTLSVATSTLKTRNVDSKYIEIAHRGLLNCEAAIENKKDVSAYTVRQAVLFNSPRADYSPALLPTEYDQIYFSTTRRQTQGNDISGITGMKAGDIFYSRKDEKGNWKRVEPAEGGINTTDDEGACCFSPDGSTMYFTVCRTDAKYPRMAEIWQSTRSDATWSKPTQVKISADTLSDYAHPAVSPDGKWLYFSSNMPGGFGGYDLWRIRIGEHGAGGVENLGSEINTDGNEEFPTFRPNGDFYFSSDGRTPNWGGLDIYCVPQFTKRFRGEDVLFDAEQTGLVDTLYQQLIVDHLPTPMNSQGDDFGITFDGLHNRGYFSSSRSTGGRGWDKIFEFSYPERLLTVKGWVYEQDGYELPSAQVYIVGTDGTNQKISVLPNGSFEAPVQPGVNYLLMAVCNGYLNVRQQLRLDTLSLADVERAIARQNKNLRKDVTQYVLQFPLPNISIPVLVRGIYYQFDKAAITDSSSVALNRLVTLLKENPNVTIELAAHCDYRGTDAYNDHLSQQRAEAVVAYLVKQGIARDRLTPMGYGKRRPKVVTTKLHAEYPFLAVGDTLTAERISSLRPAQQEIANALNRRTEFRVLRTTYGLFDKNGNYVAPATKPKKSEANEPNAVDIY